MYAVLIIIEVLGNRYLKKRNSIKLNTPFRLISVNLTISKGGFLHQEL